MATAKTQPERTAQASRAPHRTKIDLPLEAREQMIELLNQRLADVIDLRLQAKQAHWNVKGPQFIALHELFDKIADDANEWMDDIAERAVILGGNAYGTVRQAARNSSLGEYPLDIHDGRAHVDALSTTLAACGKLIREGIDQADELGDADTADLFTAVSRDLDKYLWFVEAHQQADR